jgi:hypothetical protein
MRIVTDSLDLWDGWDVGDSINVQINHGLTNINESFVISGIRWFGESSGVERLELDLVQGTYFASSFANLQSSSTAGGSGTFIANTITPSFYPRARG